MRYVDFLHYYSKTWDRKSCGQNPMQSGTGFHLCRCRFCCLLAAVTNFMTLSGEIKRLSAQEADLKCLSVQLGIAVSFKNQVAAALIGKTAS